MAYSREDELTMNQFRNLEGNHQKKHYDFSKILEFFRLQIPKYITHANNLEKYLQSVPREVIKRVIPAVKAQLPAPNFNFKNLDYQIIDFQHSFLENLSKSESPLCVQADLCHLAQEINKAYPAANIIFQLKKRNFQCKQCERSFNRVNEFMCHMKTIHNQNKVKRVRKSGQNQMEKTKRIRRNRNREAQVKVEVNLSEIKESSCPDESQSQNVFFEESNLD